MGRKSKFPIEKKIKAVEDYLNGIKGASQISFELQINENSFREWVRKYNLFGREGFITNSNNKYYPEWLKSQVVTDYLNGVGSLTQVCSKYEICHHGLLHQWIKKYNNHEVLKSHIAKGYNQM